jgi:putative DNA primase/helicase
MAEDEKKEKKPSLTTMLVGAAQHAQFFRDGDRTFARFDVDSHTETWPVRSIQVRTWLSGIAWEERRTYPSPATLKGVQDTLDGLVRQGGPQAPANIRVARTEAAVHIDLGTADWTCARVTAQGWEIVPHPHDGPYFYRPKRMQALPVPVGGGDLEALLRPFLNLRSEDDLRLIVAGMVDAIKGRGPYVVMVYVGSAGSGKSTNAKVHMSIIDPSKSRARQQDEAPTSIEVKVRSERDFPSIVGHSHVVGMDNLSHIEDWLSDRLCVTATGGDISERTLFENFEQSTLPVSNPVVLNGIESFVTRGDLADRSIRIDVPPMPDDQRREEAEFWSAFADAHPAILGALLDTLSAAMREHQKVELDRKPRMADFARWGVAVERALGWPEGSFLAAYERNRAEIVGDMLSNDLSATMLIRFMADKPSWSGTATELLTALNMVAMGAGIDTRVPVWPKTPHAVSGKLRRLEPVLPRFGITVAWTEPDRNSVRAIVITNAQVGSAQAAIPTAVAF